MANQKVNIDKLALEVSKQLEAYGDMTIEATEEVVNKVASATVNEIRQGIIAEGINGKNYARSWSKKRNPDLKGKWKYSMVVYSKDPYYRLGHLLEFGHKSSGWAAKRTKEAVRGRPHIEPASKTAERLMVAYMKRALDMIRKGQNVKL